MPDSPPKWRVVTPDTVYDSVRAAAEATGLSPITIYSRVRLGQPPGWAFVPHPEREALNARNAEIKQRYLSGESIPSLARAFALTKQRVSQIATRGGDRRPRLIPPTKPGSRKDILRRMAEGEVFPKKSREPRGPRVLEILRLREAGHSYTEIEALTGAAQPTVSMVLKRWRPDLMAWGTRARPLVATLESPESEKHS